MADAPTSYPLVWPVGFPRAKSREDARFGTRHENGGMRQATVSAARDRLQAQLDALGVSGTAILSTNVSLTLNGQPRGGQAEPSDPGAVIYFTLKGKAIALPCDRWRRVADNIVALAKHIDSMRGQERWGVGSIEQAFAGYAALPAPEAKRHWTAILKIPDTASREDITAAYRGLAKDAGIDQARMLELNLARDEAMAARTLPGGN